MLISLFVAGLLATTTATAMSPTLNLTSAQAEPAPAPARQPAPGAPAPSAGFPILAPAVEVADCGRLLATPAYCVSAQLTEVGALAENYIETLHGLGWIAADGDDNRVIFVRRREGGGCDGMQMIAFYDEKVPVTPTTVGYLGFAAIPGDICTSAPTAGATPQ